MKKDSFSYEFGGPVGTALITVTLPMIVLALLHWADAGRVEFLDDVHSIWKSNAALKSSPDVLLHCSIGLAAWLAWQVGLERLLPADIVWGVPIHGNEKHRLSYRINGHLAFWVTLLVMLRGWPVWHETSGTWQLGAAASPVLSALYTYTAPLALVTSVFCLLGSMLLYGCSHFGNKILAHGGNSGNVVYDFFLGRELNPRIGSFDLKVFCELRPGLMGWLLLNAACWQLQHAQLGYVSGSMLLINVFQGIYIWDALFQERAILTTMDVTTDGFGYMLLFGDLVWVPFTYSLQARYLVRHDPLLSRWALLGILALYGVGYAIFRGANGQKDAFRRNPNDPAMAHLTYMFTKRGTRLLTSGWWGMARKINYTGDWLMGLAWCLTGGIDSIVPYYYAIYFAILLVHRSMRDDHLCAQKYGDDWEEYKRRVPYRFIPGLI